MAQCPASTGRPASAHGLVGRVVAQVARQVQVGTGRLGRTLQRISAPPHTATVVIIVAGSPVARTPHGPFSFRWASATNSPAVIGCGRWPTRPRPRSLSVPASSNVEGRFFVRVCRSQTRREPRRRRVRRPSPTRASSTRSALPMVPDRRVGRRLRFELPDAHHRPSRAVPVLTDRTRTRGEHRPADLIAAALGTITTHCPSAERLRTQRHRVGSPNSAARASDTPAGRCRRWCER